VLNKYDAIDLYRLGWLRGENLEDWQIRLLEWADIKGYKPGWNQGIGRRFAAKTAGLTAKEDV
jgi:hypothetical protein